MSEQIPDKLDIHAALNEQASASMTKRMGRYLRIINANGSQTLLYQVRDGLRSKTC